jgi:hypothetical protein
MIVTKRILSCVLMQCLVMVFSGGLSFPDSVSAKEEDTLREIMESVVFMYDSATTPCDPEVPSVPPRKALRPIGSGFLITLKPETSALADAKSPRNLFLITARHVIGSRDAVVIRMNTAEKTGFICLPVKLSAEEKGRNVFVSQHPEVDLAAIRLPEMKNAVSVAFDFSMILDEDGMNREGISEGTDIFTVGYVFGYYGDRKNISVVRFGKISLLSTEAWYQSDTPRNMYEHAYLAEIQSEPGLSGSPVMLRSPQLRYGADSSYRYEKVKPYIIGVLKGGLRSWIAGDQGMAAIEPAYHLRDLLEKIINQLAETGISSVKEQKGAGR